MAVCPAKSLLVLFFVFATTAQGSDYEPSRAYLSYLNEETNVQISSECSQALLEFAESASNFTLCALQNARPIHMCEHCISNYTRFKEKYDAALNLVVNSTGTNTMTTCKSILISHDKLDIVLSFHNNILGVWNRANCHACYDWTENVPTPSNRTLKFYELFNTTKECINGNILPNLNNSEQVCKLCMDGYVELDTYYESLSKDGEYLGNICMDIIDSMNTTRSVWSGLLNCCRLREHRELAFLITTGVLGALPLLFYITVRYCGTMRHLPTILKQTRFKQTFLAALQPSRRTSS